MRFSLLGSGSSGNCTWVETREVAILIDAGLSARETERRLGLIDRGLDRLTAVLLTHEHDDHARGLEALTLAQPLAVIATRGTLRAVKRFLPPATERIEIRREGEVRLGDLTVTAFPVPHDAADPVGFRLAAGPAELGYATDLGMVNELVRERLGGLTALILEANHDVDMVLSGPYPARLKKRILSPFGHLSNEALGEFLRTADLSRLELLSLAHLSRTNNRPDLASTIAALALAERAAGATLRLAMHDRPTAFEEVCLSQAAAHPAPGGVPPPRRAPDQLAFGF